MSVAVVTDSTAYLPAELVRTSGVRVVPLHVVLGGRSYAEGIEVSTAEVAAALRGFTPVTTSRPTPQAFLETYASLAAAGFGAVVSVHLSADLSGTVDAATLAAAQAPVPVQVVDSRSMGMAMGYAVLSAAAAAAAGADAAAVAAAARARADAARAYFYVDTLEHLRRGGRIGAASALLGSALAIKPLLALRDGRIEPVERVRTASRALARLEELAAAAAAGSAAVEAAVHHLDAAGRAEGLATRLGQRLQAHLAGEVLLVELGAVVGAHVGPGTIAVVVSPVPPGDDAG